jgi:hypothetical protein
MSIHDLAPRVVPNDEFELMVAFSFVYAIK